ncbi:MAG: histidine kinase [Latescibacteria bacterium DG_63]|nr:MAG: histidine kinase [Latescibacteria bacterium DG_63]
MRDLSLHILDIAENSIRAQARSIEIKIKSDSKKDLLTLEIADDGKGMNQETLKMVLDPFFTTKTTRRFGLGLPLLAESARMANGEFSVTSEPGRGTRVRATFQESHIDTKPLGDIPGTVVTLIMGYPDVDVLYSHSIDSSEYCLDTREIKAQLEDVPINSPEVIEVIRRNIDEGLANLRRKK